MEVLFELEKKLTIEFQSNAINNQNFVGYSTFIENILFEIQEQRVIELNFYLFV